MCKEGFLPKPIFDKNTYIFKAFEENEIRTDDLSSEPLQGDNTPQVQFYSNLGELATKT
ncbi:hypothetical protein [Emticicia sp. W12TSBA100-4]|uniref:hypothetical protein n=1 Tax=Emticicia sp. W12TSBA100-4 TaxID=3160965 RepID=UPI0033061146